MSDTSESKKDQYKHELYQSLYHLTELSKMFTKWHDEHRADIQNIKTQQAIIEEKLNSAASMKVEPTDERAVSVREKHDKTKLEQATPYAAWASVAYLLIQEISKVVMKVLG